MENILNPAGMVSSQPSPVAAAAEEDDDCVIVDEVIVNPPVMVNPPPPQPLARLRQMLESKAAQTAAKETAQLIGDVSLYRPPKITSGVFVYLKALLLLDHVMLTTTLAAEFFPQICDQHHMKNHTFYNACMLERRFLKYTMPR
uniref:G_PROTEIN_RECEP_F1_2 domain-containing protein n=1 Tax=Caenorhabditis tropicalis TaxID=1561998 RepID=A0A1I7V390_9PELO